MPAPRAYCDWNATAPIRPDVAAAVTAALGLANPSSVHQEGRAARAAVEAARGEVAALAGVRPGDVVFTSGGTEAAAMALQPVHAEECLYTGAAEHAAVRAGGRFPRERIRIVPVDADGRLDFSELDIAVAQREGFDGPVHVAVQVANNETGAVTPVETFAAIKARGWHVTADAVQAAGRIELAPYAALADALLLSAHKIGGPKGVGALVFNPRTCGTLRPLIAGGGQERGYRGGTENVAGIVGFGVAARLAKAGLPGMTAIAAVRDAFEAGLKRLAPEATIFSSGVPRLANTSLFAIPGLKAETAVIAFDLDGVAVSSGAACSSGKVTKSHVLKAMGVADDLAAAAIRISFGWTSTLAEVEACLSSLERQLARLRVRPTVAA